MENKTDGERGKEKTVSKLHQRYASYFIPLSTTILFLSLGLIQYICIYMYI